MPCTFFLLVPSQQVDMLEKHMTSVTDQLSRQVDVQRASERRSKKLEVDIMDYEARFKNFDNDLCNRDVMQDRLKSDKHRVRMLFLIWFLPLPFLVHQTSDKLVTSVHG